MINISPAGAAQVSEPKEPQTLTIPAASRQADTGKGEHGGEPVKEAAKEEKEDFLSPKFAMLAKREKQLRSIEEANKAESARLAALAAKYDTDYIPKSRLKTETPSALKDAGVSYDEVTEQYLKAPASEVDPVIQAQEAKIAALEEKLEKLTGKFDTKETTEYERAVNSLKGQAKKLVDSDERFETIKAYELSDEVVKRIEDIYNNGGTLGTEEFEKGTVLEIEKVATFLEDETFAQLERVSSLKKFQSKLNPTPPVKDPAEKQLKPLQPQPMKTLTNSVTTSKPLSARERAILAMQGKLN